MPRAPQVLGRGGRTQRGDRKGDSGLVQPYHVHVALDDEQPLKLDARLTHFVQAVQLTALVKQVGLG